MARIRAHHDVALELLGIDRVDDARLQASKPITDVLPELVVELRARHLEVAGLSAAIVGVASAVRHGAAQVARAVEAASVPLDETLQSVAASALPAFRASVAATLVERASRAYRQALESGELDVYQEAYALGRWAAQEVEVYGQVDFGAVMLASPLPPSSPVEIVVFERSAQHVRTELVRRLGALSDVRSPLDELERVVLLLDGVAHAYTTGTEPIAARLASEAYVRGYSSLREELKRHAPGLEAELEALLGTRLRVAINDREHQTSITSLVETTKELLSDAREALRGRIFPSGPPRAKK